MAPAAEVLGLRQADALPSATAAWDAWDGVLPDEAEALTLVRLDAGAEKSADLELDGPAQDAERWR